MTSLATTSKQSQLTLNFEPSIADRFPTLRAYLAHRVAIQVKSQKVIAADMDMSPSMLSRKLNPSEGDTQRFNLDDLEGYIVSSGDVASVIEYLAAKFMDDDEARKARVLSKVEGMLPELMGLLASMKATA